MFKELYELWRKDNLLTQAFNASFEMLEKTSLMFDAAVKSLRYSNIGAIDIDIYEVDRVVNRFEQEVRRNVMKHLAITGSIHISPGLVLVSIVVDIERVGDYTKNIMDLAVDHPKKLHCGSFEDSVIDIEQKVANIFKQAIPILKKSDAREACLVINDNWTAKKQCDKIVTELIKGGDDTLSTSDAVTTALYVRYLKRVAAHLMNVMSSVVNPFEQIGYRIVDSETKQQP